MVNYAEELSCKRRELYDLLEQSIEDVDSNSDINERIVDQLIQFEDLIKCFQNSLELKTGAKISIKPKFKVDGSYALGSSSELSELLKNVDFQTQFTAKYRNSLIKQKNAPKHKINTLLNVRLNECPASERPNTTNKSGQPHHRDDQDESTPSASSTKGKTLHVNRKITSNLIRTNQILRSSVLQTELNLDDLKQQTATLALVNDKFDHFTQLAKTSSNLIRAINNSSGRDKQKVYISITFFAVCILYVLWRRIFKYPVKFFLWICFKFFKSILNSFSIISHPTKNISEPTLSYLNVAAAASSSIDRILDEL